MVFGMIDVKTLELETEKVRGKLSDIRAHEVNWMKNQKMEERPSLVNNNFTPINMI